MKKVGLLVVGLLAVLSLSVASAAKFSDVPPGHWAEEAVYKLADEGIILGFPDGTYRGNEFLTRYQAALLIYRLLERLRAEFKAGVDEETLAALRNAVQELAAELASLGVRVSALEDNAATKGDVAKLQAAIEELKKMKPAGVDMAALKDLEAKVEAAAVAADAAAAKAEAAMAAADSAKGLAEANADSIKALNELAVMLNQDVLGLQDRVAALEKEVVALKNAKPQGFAKASDLKALTEYVQALSGDVASLAGRIEETNARIDDLAAKVDANLPTFSGSLSAKYYTSWGNSFDVDALGATLGNGKKTKADLGVQEGKFSTKFSISFNLARNGSSDPNGLNVQSVGLSFSTIESLGAPELTLPEFNTDDAVSWTDSSGIGTDTDGDGLNSFLYIDNDGDGRPSAGDYILVDSLGNPVDSPTDALGNDLGIFWVVIQSAPASGSVAGLSIINSDLAWEVVAVKGSLSPWSEAYYGLDGDAFYAVVGVDSNNNGVVDGWVMKPVVATKGVWTVLDEITSSFSIGQAPIEMTFAKLPKFKFTEYIADNDAKGYGPGLLVKVSDLPLGASLQAVTVSKNTGGASDGTGGDNDYLHGARLTLAPMKGFSIGASYVKHNNPALSGGSESIYGFDASAKFGPVTLGGEYAADSAGTSLYYVKGGATFGPVTLSGNYRNVGTANFVSKDGIQGDNNDAPFKNEKGFGIEASAKFAFLTFSATYDSFTEVNGAKGSKAMLASATSQNLSETAWKVAVEADLFAGFSLKGCYAQATDVAPANIAWSHDGNDSYDDTTASGTASFRSVAKTTYGVTLKNEGLIKGLSLEGYYKSVTYNAGGNFGKTSLGGKLDFSTKLAILNTKLYASYDKTSFSPGTTFSDVLYAAGIDHAGTADDVTTINAGASVETDPFSIVFKPSFMASVDYHSGSHSRLSTYNATDLKWSVGLALNEFFTEHSKFTAKYMSRDAQNYSVVKEKDANGASYQASGFELGWNYYDLQITYGSYTSGSSKGQAFKISYTLKF